METDRRRGENNMETDRRRGENNMETDRRRGENNMETTYMIRDRYCLNMNSATGTSRT